MHMIPPPPPSVQDMPAGTRLIAGMGVATVLPDLDFETYSEAGYHWNEAAQTWDGPPGAAKDKKGLPVIGAARYAAHPSTEVLMAAYDLKDGRGKRFWFPGMPAPLDLFEYLQRGGLIEAHNVMFERLIWEHVCVKRMGWPAVQSEQWRCSAAKARAFALPGALGEAAEVLRLAAQKDTEGTRLIKQFSMPRKPTKADPRKRIPLDWSGRCADTIAFGRYNVRDIEAEAELSSRLPDLEGEELAWWQVDQASNHRGVAADVPSLEHAAAIVNQVLDAYNAELHALTGIDSASKVKQLLGWLAGRGVRLGSMDEETVDAALARTDLDPESRRVLEIRSRAGSASVKKVFAMLNQVSDDGRMRGLYVYHGARTGRDTGGGPQPTNLPSAGPNLHKCKSCGQHFGEHHVACPFCNAVIAPGQEAVEWNPTAAEQCIAQLPNRSMRWLEHLYGDALHVIAGTLRGMYVAGPGHDMISTDYNSIEAVGLAMVSGEQWRIDTFRTHGKIYEKSAAMMFGVSFEEMMRTRGYSDEQLAVEGWWTLKPANPGAHHPLRKKGKVGELAFGYQGWLGAAQEFGMPGTDEEIKRDILAWRDASPSVVHLWGGQERRQGWERWSECYGVEGAFVQAALSPGVRCPVLRLDGSDTRIAYERRGDTVYCQLPSGRWLHYHSVRLEPSDRGGGWAISFEGWNTNPKNGPKGWIRMRTWGGRLVENLIQAICRDILRFACIRLERFGYPVVMRTYDEIVSEVPEGVGSIAQFEEIVTVPPDWASDWPIRAPDGWRAKRYRK